MTITLDRPAVPTLDPVDDVTRREFVLGGLSLAALVAACGDDDASDAPSTATGGQAWEFTDDRGETARLDVPPARIVTLSLATGALWALGVRPVGMLGEPRRPDGGIVPLHGDVAAELTSVGEYPEINLERLAGLRPDLIVDNLFNDTLDTVEATPGQEDRVLELAPVVGISTTGLSVTAVIDRFAELAAALGADLDAPELAAARTRYEDAAEELRHAAAAKPALRVMICWTPAEQLEVANPRTYPFGLLLEELGVGLVEPDVADANAATESLSWELADTYPADLIVRFVNPEFEETEAGAVDNPLWERLPAVQAGQVTTWDPSWHLNSYDNYARILANLRDAIETANVL